MTKIAHQATFLAAWCSCELSEATTALLRKKRLPHTRSFMRAISSGVSTSQIMKVKRTAAAQYYEREKYPRIGPSSALIPLVTWQTPLFDYH
jgi:hypothetical protein